MSSIILNEKDNVATVLEDYQKGSIVQITDSYQVETLELIPFGHKISLVDMSLGTVIYKYGEPIGKATQSIKKGSWVHDHNCESIRGLGR